MRTQPQAIIEKLEADNSRLSKEAILLDAMNEGLDEFFEGVRMCLDPLYTFGVKQVPQKIQLFQLKAVNGKYLKNQLKNLETENLQVMRHVMLLIL